MAHHYGEQRIAQLGPERGDPPAPGRCVVAPGDPLADRDEILRLAGNLPDSPGAARFAKYYDRSPYGPPFVFLAREPESGRAVGMAALLPARLRIGGEPVPAAISADFSIDPAYRGFGPALALQRATLKVLDEQRMRCAYGCPNRLSEPIVKRVGYEDAGELTRFVKVLRTKLVVDLYVHRRGPARLLSTAATVTADPVLRLVAREQRRGRDRNLSFETPGSFDDRFSDVWEATARRHAITGERRADVLNWKYELDTGRPSDYAIFAAVDTGGRVAGYVVYRVKDRVRHIFDIASLGSQPVIDALLAGFLADARRERATGVTFLCLGALGLLGRRLRSFGFLSRSEDKRLRVYVQDPPPGIDLLERDNWYFVMGDDDF